MISNVRSSLIYQLLMCAQETISIIFFATLFILFWYKGDFENRYKTHLLISGSILPYQKHTRVMELLILLPFAPIEYLRIKWGKRGNILENSAFLLLSSFLSAPIILITVYFAFFQNYVLFIEEISSYVFGILVIFQTILGFSLSIAFSGTSTTSQPAVES